MLLHCLAVNAHESELGKIVFWVFIEPIKLIVSCVSQPDIIL